MDRRARNRPAIGRLAALAALALAPMARGEDLGRAWQIALTVNARQQARQLQSTAARAEVDAAEGARLGSVRNFTINALVTPQPNFGQPSGLSTGTSNNGSGGTAVPGLGGSIGLLGGGQNDVPLTTTSWIVPVYTGGRLLRQIDATAADADATRAEEFRSALDLKLTVAEAYIDVLRAEKTLQVAESNVERLRSFADDVANRLDQGLATREDVLSARVDLSRARQDRIRAVEQLTAARAGYNRYLRRPPTAPVVLDELAVAPPPLPPGAADPMAGPLPAAAEAEIEALERRALANRPELAGLAAQARSLDAQADVRRASLKPQLSVTLGHAYLGLNSLSNTNFLTSAAILDWTLADFGSTRRRTDALRLRSAAAARERADAAADVMLEVRTRWLELDETRRRVPVAREAIALAEEALSVVLDRYGQGLSTYTQVLDAETRRVRALDDYYDALYDAVLGALRLRRAVGEL